MSGTNPNNCPNCDHYKSQRAMEAADETAMKLHCYHFRLAPTEVCMQHTGRKLSFFDMPDISFFSTPMPDGKDAKTQEWLAKFFKRPSQEEIAAAVKDMFDELKEQEGVPTSRDGPPNSPISTFIRDMNDELKAKGHNVEDS